MGGAGWVSASAGVSSGASAGVTSESTPCQAKGLCDCSNGQTAGGCCACGVASAGGTSGAATGSAGAVSGAASGSAGGCSDMGTIHANLTSWQCGCNACWCEHDTITKTTIVCPSADAGAGKEAGSSAPPSCAPGGPGMTNCGPGGSGTESCCTSLEVAGGTYFRTYTNYGSDPTGEADPATVSSFRLDKYLVTAGRFRQFANAWQGGWTPAAGSGKHTHLNGGLGLVNVGSDAGLTYEPGWASSDDGNVAPTDASKASNGLNSNLVSCAIGTASSGSSSASSSNDALPITSVNWWEAYAFCIWDGGFLPSESEWEYAAAGGNDQREYPWGAADPGTSNQYAIYACYYSVVSPNADPCPGNIAPVGASPLGAGRWGQLDLVGNVPQWCADSPAPYVNPCSDCGNFTVIPLKVLRGGVFGEGPAALLPPLRLAHDPAIRDCYDGFRCARIP